MDRLLSHPVCHLIDGELVDGPVSVDVIDPSTAQACARAPLASTAMLDTAVLAAQRAQPGWSRTTVAERRERLSTLAQMLRQHCAELAALTTLEQGRPLARATDEVLRAAQLLEAVIALEVSPRVLREDAAGRVVMLARPLGVVGAITPWNVPIGLAVPKIVHALFTGNTVVLKPSPYTPLATLRLGELARGLFPAGVLNILSGGNAIGQGIAEHAGIAKISFTGSIATGRRVMAAASAHLKRLTLELGGNDAALVLEDADVERIAPQLWAAAFVNSGQVCMAIKRLFVHERVYDALCEALAEQARRVRVGPGFDPASELGPVQNKAQFASVQAVLADTQGRPEARILAGGRALDRPGYFIAPTIVAGLQEGCALVDEETFGPVLPILRFSSDQEAVQRANGTDFGLGASVWSSDPERAQRLALQLDAGTVWINRHVGVDAGVPFGGAKASGLGCQFGVAGLLDCMQQTAVYIPHAVSGQG